MDLGATGAICLQAVTKCVPTATIMQVTQFVDKNIQMDDWHKRNDANVALSCIISRPTAYNLKKHICQHISTLVYAFSDDSIMVGTALGCHNV